MTFIPTSAMHMPLCQFGKTKNIHGGKIIALKKKVIDSLLCHTGNFCLRL